MKLTKDDLSTMIKDAVQEAVPGIVSAVAKEVVKEEVEEVKAEVVEEVKIAPALKDDGVEDRAQKEANSKEWGTFGAFCKGIFDYRFRGAVIDNRLVFIDKHGNPTVPTEQPVDSQKDAQVLKTLTEGVDSAGGFLVPEIFVNQVRQIGLERSLVRGNGATVLPMSSDTLLIPRVDDTDHSSNVFGGVLAYWTEEAGTKQATDPKFGQCRLNAKELSGISVISDALLADNAVGLEALMKRMFGEAWAYYEDDAFLNGNGVGQPLGILNSGALISQTRTDTNNITFADIPNMWARLFTESRDRSVWFMNQEVEKDLFKAGFSGTTITSGDVPFILPANMGAVANPPTKIFGRPFFVTEKMAALGSAGDIGLFDLSYYIIGDRSKLAIDASKHVYFTTNRTCWRFVIRVDGQPWLASPLTPKNGTDTIGPFVTLTSTS